MKYGRLPLENKKIVTPSYISWDGLSDAYNGCP